MYIYIYIYIYTSTRTYVFKVLNVRDANFKQVTGNMEIQNLLKICGLDIRTILDVPKPRYRGAPNLCEDIY